MNVPTYDEFSDAQTRLDDGLHNLTTAEGRAQHAADVRLTDWYDANVLGPAEYERMWQDDQAEFEWHYPEPADGTRVEWERDCLLWAAYRDDLSWMTGDGVTPEARWCLYGEDTPHTWRQLVCEHEISMADLTVLASVSATDSG